jgi:uncharacterized protein (DUF362 family)
VAQDYNDLGAIKDIVVTAIETRADIMECLKRVEPPPLVVVKPNWIQDSHEYEPEVWEPVITHPDLVITVIEALAERLEGKGTICICDAPITYADFDAILGRGALKEKVKDLQERFPELGLEIIDLRREIWLLKEQVVVERRRNTFDPRGYVRLNLGQDSMFYNNGREGRYHGADYDSRVVNAHHCGDLQEYLLAGTPMACDLFVNLPKLKTHRKAGLTCCLKNLVGINGDKNWLPHHVRGSPETGGDEFPEDNILYALESWTKMAGQKMVTSVPVLGTYLYRKARNIGKAVLGDSGKVIRNGNWEGNNTCWRMVIDLNRALLYGNIDGTWREAGSRKLYLAIVDGIVGGEGNGPDCPDHVRSGVLISGTDPAQVDAAACRVMGFNPRDLPIVAHSFDRHRWPISEASIDELPVYDERVGKEVLLDEVAPAMPGGFKPHFGWPKLASGS